MVAMFWMYTVPKAICTWWIPSEMRSGKQICAWSMCLVLSLILFVCVKDVPDIDVGKIRERKDNYYGID